MSFSIRTIEMGACMPYLLSTALHVILPFGILYSDISGLRQITLPWREQIMSV